MMPVASCIPFPFSVPCDDMLTMLVCATHWPSMHLHMLAYMSMHKFCLLVCCPYFNTMKLWTPNPNLHLSLTDTTFCLLVCLLFGFFACHAYHAYPLYAFSYALCIFFFHCLELGHNLPGTSKKGTDASMWLSQAAIFNRFRSLAFPFWFCTL